MLAERVTAGMSRIAATVPGMSDLYKPGPYDLAYKPERIAATDWACMQWWDRYEVARRESPVWQAEAELQRVLAELGQQEDRREFRGRFPLVDLDGIPTRAWGLPGGTRCIHCHIDADWPGVQHGQSGLQCWLWQAAYFYCEQSGACAWCGDGMAANLAETSIDHIIPSSLDGPDDRWNRQLLHSSCNSRKGARLTDQARELADAHGFVMPPAAVRGQ